MPVQPAPTSQHSAKLDSAWYWNFGAIVLFWACYLSLQVPIPGVNEPHYLCKAKHFWQPDYCRGDFFLDSANTHYVFYVTFGWLTKFFPLATVAFVGRMISLSLLAASWTTLTRRLSSVNWAPVGSAAIFLGITSWQNFSGEWVVGGLESKVIAYGCLFFAWSCLFDQRWIIAAVLFGVGISFHPVVAGWGLIATCLGAAYLLWQRGSSCFTFSTREFSACCVVVIVCSLPGLIPALSTLMSPIDGAEVADRLQVFRRLGHHLNPVQFPARAYWVYGLLFTFWILLAYFRGVFRKHRGENEESTLTLAQSFWHGIVLGSLVIAFAGLAIGWGQQFIESQTLSDLFVKLMKFYPFRLSDVILPLAVGLSVIELSQHLHQIIRWRSVTLKVFSLACAITSLALVLPSRNVDGYSPAKTESWVNICRWIDRHLSQDALVMAPRSSVTFRWYASRAAYVTFKDCPQDAAGILEWNRRLNLYQKWASQSYEDDKKYSDDELLKLVELTGATHLLVSRMGPFDRDPLHQNKHYRLYELPEADH